MGHWADQLVDEVAARVGADPIRDRETLLAAVRAAGAQMELLTGQSFGQAKQNSVSVETFGLPFIDLPGLQIGTEKSSMGGWPIPNPIERDRATVVQVAQFTPLPSRAMPIASALAFAGHLTHAVAQAGGLAGDHMIRWLGHTFRHEERVEFMHRLTDPSNLVNVPITAGANEGWWFQITRRLLWVTHAIDEQRLVESLIKNGDDALRALCAFEPVLIVARITKHPVDWAMPIRIWPSVERRPTTPWPRVSGAIRHHGVPILTLDPRSTTEEIQAQLLLLAYWHGYIDADEPGLADVIASAFPKPVARVAGATRAPDRRSAAALLLEGLLHPGFDPAMGADAIRRYVSRKATIAIRDHWKTSDGGARRWEALGVSERQYYKLLKRFAPKVGTRYEVDERVLEQIRVHLTRGEQHAAGVALLQQRGFSYPAARKWLQRHPPSEAINAWPRGSRGREDSAQPSQ